MRGGRRIPLVALVLVASCTRDRTPTDETPAPAPEAARPRAQVDLSRLPEPAPLPGTPERPCPDGATVAQFDDDNGARITMCVNGLGVQHGPLSRREGGDDVKSSFDGEWRNGKRHGLAVMRYRVVDDLEMGTVYEAVDDVLVREHTYTEGVRTDTKELDAEGKVVRHTTWYPNGAKASEMGVVADDIHGTATTWWPNGQKSSEGAFEHGSKVGTWRYWDRDGGEIDERRFDALMQEGAP